MEKIKYRAVIRFFVLKGLKVKEIYEQLLEVWAGEFKLVVLSLKTVHTKDDQKSHPPTPEIIEQAHNITSATCNC